MKNEVFDTWSKKSLKDPDLMTEITRMKADNSLISDAFTGKLLFGTGGLRGIMGVGTNRMNIYTVRNASLGFMSLLKNNSKIAIAYDSRIKSDLFAKQAATMFANAGFKVFLFDQVSPTPLLSYTVRYLKCDGGIVITASHNPKEYNGYKVYDDNGCQVNPDAALKIFENMQKYDYFHEFDNELSFDECVDNASIEFIGNNIIDPFVDAICSNRLNHDKKSLKIVYTPLCGSGMTCVDKSLKKLKYDNVSYVVEQSKPDGTFPTCPYPNPEFKQALESGIRDLVKTDSDILIATDPDCDRVGLVENDKNGIRVFNGNETGILLLDYICNVKTLNHSMPQKPVVIKTIVTTELTRSLASKYGFKVIDVLTGFKYIGEQITHLENMNDRDSFIFGFEESCGYLSGTHVRDKDAVDAVTLICEMAEYYKKENISLSQKLDLLYKEHGYMITYLGNYDYPDSKGVERMKSIMNAYRHSDLMTEDYLEQTGSMHADVVEFDIFQLGKAIVRPSGTEPKIKIYYSVQHETRQKSENKLKELVFMIENLMKQI